MRCDTAQRILSDRLDDPASATDAVDDHVADCAACAAFDLQINRWRRHLRLAPLEPPPDIAGAVHDRLATAPSRRTRHRPRAPWARAAAVFVVAFALGAAVVGPVGPQRLAAVELDHLVRAAQHRVHTLEARVTVTEHGWHPEVPVRRYAGTLAYEAPETLALRLSDLTRYPDERWRDNDVTVVVDGATAWSSARSGCPSTGLPDCLAATPRTTVVTGREPFDPAEAVPLDLVVPVDSFGAVATAGATTAVTADGREAVQVTTTVSQVRPLLDGVVGLGTWRDLHATDRATVALDAQYGIPLRVEVTAADGDERARWGAATGHVDRAGQVLWRWELDEVAINAGPPRETPPPPPDPDRALDRGFVAVDTTLSALLGDLPGALTQHRVGKVGDVVVGSWSDGRAWLRVRVHGDWDHPRLFGRSGGELVRRVRLADGGTVYVVEGGRELFLHGPDHDIAITGSLTPEELLSIAERSQVRGRTVPSHWLEANDGTLAEARQALPGLLVPASSPAFSGPGVRVGDDAVALSYSGNGDRGFVLSQGPGDVLGPPLDDVVLGVRVRGVDGRYTPRTGTLEWVEHGHVVSLRSSSLTRAELVAIAHHLEPAA